jgi:hypothetical protein
MTSHEQKSRVEKNNNGRYAGKKKLMTGAEEALGDNVYVFSELKAGDKYTRTTEAIVNYIEKRIKNVGAKVADSIRMMRRMDITRLEPQEPTKSINEKGEIVEKPMTRNWHNS